MSLSAIRAALETVLDTFATSQAMPVAWENVPAGQAKPYLRAHLLPAPTTSDTLDGVHRAYRGVLQVSVVCAINTGAGQADAIADLVAAAFPMADRIAGTGLTVQITAPASIAPALQNEHDYTVPVSIRYRADTV